MPAWTRDAAVLADENVDPHLVLGLQRRVGGIDIVSVQEVGLRTADDQTILEWVASEQRIVISRDIKTIPDFAHARLAVGQPMPGVFVLALNVSMSIAIDELTAVAGASDDNEWVDRVIYLPLR